MRGKSSERRVAWPTTTADPKPTPIRIHIAATNSNFSLQADKIQTILGAAKVPEVEPIWSSIFAKVNTRSLPRHNLLQKKFSCEPRSFGECAT